MRCCDAACLVKGGAPRFTKYPPPLSGDHAACLDSSQITTFRHVTLPLIPGVTSAAVFALAASFDEVVVAFVLTPSPIDYRKTVLDAPSGLRLRPVRHFYLAIETGGDVT